MFGNGKVEWRNYTAEDTILGLTSNDREGLRSGQCYRHTITEGIIIVVAESNLKADTNNAAQTIFDGREEAAKRKFWRHNPTVIIQKHFGELRIKQKSKRRIGVCIGLLLLEYGSTLPDKTLR